MICYSNDLFINFIKIFSRLFSCKIIFNLLQSLLGFSDEKNVEIPEATIAGYLSNIISKRSRVELLPVVFTSNYISFAKAYLNFLSNKLAR